MNVREDLKAYVDGELQLARRREIEGAIAADAALAKEVSEIESLSRAIQTSSAKIPVPEMPQSLESLASRPRKTMSPTRRFAWLGWSAAAIALIAILPKLVPVMGQDREAAKRATAVAGSSADSLKMSDATASPLQKMAAKSQAYTGKDRAATGAAPNGDSMAEASPSVSARQSANGPSQAGPLGQPLVIQSATLSVETKNVAEAVQSATLQVKGLGGWVSNLQSATPDGQSGTASLSVRVPESKFNDAIQALHALGTVKSQSMTGEDVTTQVVDVEARLKTMRIEEEQYRTILGKTRRLGDILEVKDRLGSVRQEIESLAAQQKSLRNQANYSTISLTLTEKPKAGLPDSQGDWASDSWSSAVNGLQTAGRFLGAIAIVLFVYAPIWIPLAILGWLAYRKARR